MTCSRCNAQLYEGDGFCRECGVPVSAPQLMPTVRAVGGHGEPTPVARVNRSINVLLLVVVIVLAVVAGGALTYVIVRKDKKSGPASVQGTANHNVDTPATTPTQSGNDKPSTPHKEPPTNTLPEGATRFATSMYDGVNIRSQPSQESSLLTTIGKGRGVWVYNVSDHVDTIYVQSDKRYVTDNWSNVQLADDPSLRGWIFSGFLSK